MGRNKPNASCKIGGWVGGWVGGSKDSWDSSSIRSSKHATGWLAAWRGCSCTGRSLSEQASRSLSLSLSLRTYIGQSYPIYAGLALSYIRLPVPSTKHRVVLTLRPDSNSHSLHHSSCIEKTLLLHTHNDSLALERLLLALIS